MDTRRPPSFLPWALPLVFLVGQSIPLVCGSLLPSLSLGHWSLVTGHFRFDTRQPGPPLGHRMSAPLLPLDIPCPTPLHPSRIPLMCRPCAPPSPATSWGGIPDSPYAIRNSEFGNPESGIGVQGNLHAMKDYPLTRWMMVR